MRIICIQSETFDRWVSLVIDRSQLLASNYKQTA